ncbi:MAG: cofactor assembly of complex C subunit B [Microcoleaceae cyanobacterium]
MSLPVLSSTFFLTLLLAIGLFFFVKASVKARIQQQKLVASLAADLLLNQIKQYFQSRAYRIVSANPDENQIVFEGVVRPSGLLAVFLTLLTAIGTLCLALVLSMVAPQQQNIFLGLVVLSPLAGIFYWQRAGRSEQVSLQLEATIQSENQPQSVICIQGHRDELTSLRQALNLKAWEPVTSSKP